MDHQTPLEKAIKEAGGQVALANQLGVTQSLVSFWLTSAKRGVAAEYVIAIEKVTGVSRHDLRPDVFGPRPSEAA